MAFRPGSHMYLIFFFLMSGPPPRSPLFPSTTLFRSRRERAADERRDEDAEERQIEGAPGREHHRSEEHTSELQSLAYLGCRLLLEKKKKRRFVRYEQLSNLVCTHAHGRVEG